MVPKGNNNELNSPWNGEVIQLLDTLTQKIAPQGTNRDQLLGKFQKFRLLMIGITHVPGEKSILPRELG